MIGSGLKKLAQQYGMTVGSGVAYGSLMGYATTLSEGQGYKRIDVVTKFVQPGQKDAFVQALNSVDLKKEFMIQDIAVREAAIAVVFQDTIGTMKKLEAFVAWFYPLLGNFGAAGANICAYCDTEAAGGGWYMIDGLAMRMHDSCAARVQSDMEAKETERKNSDTGSYVSGAVGAVLGALLGSVIWALMMAGGYIASIVGFVIGWLAEKGYNLFKGKQGKGKLVILIIAIILGVLVGTIAPDVVFFAQMIDSGELAGCSYGDIPELLLLTMMDSPDYQASILGSAVLGLLFAALGVFSLLRKTGREISGRKLKKLS